MHHKPRLTQLLESLQLDVTYERAAGCHLYYRDPDGEEIEVLDLVGGYGSVLFGHGHPVLVAEAQRFLAAGHPIHAQASRSLRAESLARALSQRAHGDYCVVFGNSGAEAVEAAIKHAVLESGSRTFIALDRAFHGKTLGALQFTAHPVHRAGWEFPGIQVVRVPMNDLDALDRAFAAVPRPAGFVYEPIQGEGGVHIMTADFAQHAAALCHRAGSPMIADECQTGVGRTGRFLASEALGIQPDYIVLSKALGGGLAKISALLVKRARYCDAFDLKHTSTFGGDDYSCALALKALELLTPEFLAACHDQGEHLLGRLRSLAHRFPSVIADIRGRGLLAGIEFHPATQSSSFILRYLGAQGDLAHAVAGSLLAHQRLRVAPTLSHRLTLRVQPAGLLSAGDIDHLIDGLDAVCSLISRGDARRLTQRTRPRPRPDVNGPRPEDSKLVLYDPHRCRTPCPPGATKVAWLCHMIDGGELTALDPSFHGLSPRERDPFLADWVGRAAPVLMTAVTIESVTGARVHFHPIMLPVTSAWFKQALDSRTLGVARALVHSGIEAAAALGCSVVSLGQYTSMVTANGTRLDDHGVGVTTGNSYAIALALQAIGRACRHAGLDPRRATVVVAGAGGNIGQTCARLLAPRFQRLILIGSAKAGAHARLHALADSLPNAHVSTDLADAAHGDVVLAAMNAVDAPLTDAHLATGAMVCDLGVPTCMAAGLCARRPDVRLLPGGLAALPFHEDLGIDGFPRPAGQAYACMAEAMLLGFDGLRDRVFTGRLKAEHVTRISHLAKRHGFKLARSPAPSFHPSDNHAIDG